MFDASGHLTNYAKYKEEMVIKRVESVELKACYSQTVDRQTPSKIGSLRVQLSHSFNMSSFPTLVVNCQD